MKTSLLSNSSNEPKRSRSSLLFFAAFAAFALFGCFAFAAHKATPESLESSVGAPFWTRTRDRIVMRKGKFEVMSTWPILRLEAVYPEHRYEYSRSEGGNDILYRVLVHNEMQFVDFLDPRVTPDKHKDWNPAMGKDVSYARWKMRKFAMEEVLNDDVEGGEDIDSEKSANCEACIRKWDEITNNQYGKIELALTEEQLLLTRIITAYLRRAEQDIDNRLERLEAHHERKIRAVSMPQQELQALGYAEGRTLDIFIEPPMQPYTLTKAQKAEIAADQRQQDTRAYNEHMKNNPHLERRNKDGVYGETSRQHGAKNEGIALRPNQSSTQRLPTTGTGSRTQSSASRTNAGRSIPGTGAGSQTRGKRGGRDEKESINGH